MSDPSPAPQDWRLFTGSNLPHDIEVPAAPPWRIFEERQSITRRVPADWWESVGVGDHGRATTYRAAKDTIDCVNAALHLRRPLMVTGKAGSGKSSLAYAVARELRLGPVLRWPITSRSTLQQGLYDYDAISRVHDTAIQANSAGDIGAYLRLGPLGTAFLPTEKPRVLLIDEIDKSDIDLPNDLLNLFETGEFRIKELSRLREEHKTVSVYPEDAVDDDDKVPITDGRVQCKEFPLIILTSNGERDFSAPFLRRCIRLNIAPPEEEELAKIVEAHFARAGVVDSETHEQRKELIKTFLRLSQSGELATDQLLNAVFLTCGNFSLDSEKDTPGERKQKLIKLLLQSLATADDQ